MTLHSLILLGGPSIAALVGLLILVGLLLLKKSAGTSAASSTQGDDSVKRHWLLELSDSGDSAAWHIGSRTATVGRAPTNFVQLDSEDVSRIHCQVRPKPEGLQLIDMTSSNGTLLNDKPVRVAILKDHDVVSLGNRNLVYRAEGDFGNNAGFEMKRAGKAQVQQETAVAEPRSMDKIVEVHLAYAETGENLQLTAEKVGLSEDEVKSMLGEES